MKTLIKTKLLDASHIELRSFELHHDILKVIYCQVDDYKTHSHIGDSYQIFSLKDQQKGKIVNTLKSKFPPYSYYRMYKFLFRPKGQIKDLQLVDRAIRYDNKTNTAYIE